MYYRCSDDDDVSVVDEAANAYAEGSVFRSQAGAGSAVDDPGGGVGPGSGRFGVGFWLGLRAWDFPTERVLPRLIIRTVD